MPAYRASPTPNHPLTPSRVGPSGVVALPGAIVQIASEQLIRNWSSDLGPTPTPREVEDLLGVLAASIVEIQITPLAVIDPRAHSLAGRRLLELVRGGVVCAWDQGVLVDGEVGRLLVAIERVRESTAPGTGDSELLVEMAHDLRSPLTSILFLAETLQRGQSGPVNDVQRRQLGLIYTAALGLSSVASDIVDLARSDMLIEPSPVPFSVMAVLDSIRDIVRPIAEEKQLALRCQPPAVDERMGYPVAVSRVLLNLTTNALKFTDKGYVEIVAREVGPRRMEFSVRDSGRGINPAIVSTLYDPLRATVDSGGRGGKVFSQTGLGLSICRKLSHALGSELHVETRLGWGTRFYFELDMPPCNPHATPVAAVSTITAPRLRRERRHVRRD